jgi:RNA exonuclease 4
MVDCYGRMVLNLLVKPVKAVVSYLTPLTGLTAESLDKFGQPEQDAIANLKRCLPPTAILVGMNIRKDIEWLGLVEGVDFAACIDLSDLFRVWNEERRSFT